MRRLLSVLALAAVCTAPALIATGTANAAPTNSPSCSIYYPHCGGGGGKPYEPR